jgi:hypothetical protein
VLPSLLDDAAQDAARAILRDTARGLYGLQNPHL